MQRKKKENSQRNKERKRQKERQKIVKCRKEERKKIFLKL